MPTGSRTVPPPSDGGVDSVRHLDRRFASARLREVPILRAAELDARADPGGETRIWLALEALQVTGSFHVRGALVTLERLRAKDRVTRVVAASAGNTGIAIAYAACVLGISATIVVPRTVARTKRERIGRYGAELVVVPSDRYADVEGAARDIAVAHRIPLVGGDDDSDLALGNGASLGVEIVRRLGGLPERVLVPMGDAGLATGLAWGFSAEAPADFESNVWGVQPEARWATGAWLEQGNPSDHIDVDAPTLAEELGCGVTGEGMASARAAVAGVVVVAETQIGAAMAHAYHDMGLVLEGSAAVALAPVLFGLPPEVRGGDVVVVLTGRNVDPEQLEAVLARGDGERLGQGAEAAAPPADEGRRRN